MATISSAILLLHLFFYHNYTKDVLRGYRRGTIIHWGVVDKVGVNPITGEERKTTRRYLVELDKLPTLKSFDLIDLKRVSGNFIETVRETGVILYDGRRSEKKA
jgi:hypothetical protein